MKHIFQIICSTITVGWKPNVQRLSLHIWFPIVGRLPNDHLEVYDVNISQKLIKKNTP